MGSAMGKANGTADPGSRSNSVESSATRRCARARTFAQTGAASRDIALATEHPERALPPLTTATFAGLRDMSPVCVVAQLPHQARTKRFAVEK
jgi:hypothetical protein